MVPFFSKIILINMNIHSLEHPCEFTLCRQISTVRNIAAHLLQIIFITLNKVILAYGKSKTGKFSVYWETDNGWTRCRQQGTSCFRSSSLELVSKREYRPGRCRILEQRYSRLTTIESRSLLGSFTQIKTNYSLMYHVQSLSYENVLYMVQTLSNFFFPILWFIL